MAPVVLKQRVEEEQERESEEEEAGLAVREKQSGLKSESERKWRKDLRTTKIYFKNKAICTYCRHEMS